MTFKDHLDYVRTVQFHPVHPFIVSSSDDMTIRIFNWETRSLVSTIPGHNHYVMSAFFHPSRPWILSASLDDTIRVWDVSALFNRNHHSGIFALTDTVIKYQVEEHISGVNWAAWHPTKNLAVSCSDDKTIKIWKVNDTEMCVIATLRSHMDNISCAIFHPVIDIIISAAEDNSVRLWDGKTFVHLAKFTRPSDNDDDGINRFWILAAHPTLPLFATGQDEGFTVFRLFRQRPAYCVNGNDIYFFSNNSIVKYNIASQSASPVASTKPRPAGKNQYNTSFSPPPNNFSFNPSQEILLIGYADKFEMHNLKNGKSDLPNDDAFYPTWISRNQYAYLDPVSLTELKVREARGSTIRTHTIPETKRIFAAQPPKVYLATAENVILYDTARSAQEATRYLANVRQAYISPDRKKVAFLTNHSITISSLDLSKASTFHDAAKIKSGAWCENFFIYSTKRHIKYFLSNGDGGIIRSLSSRVYIAKVIENQVICLTSNNEVKRLDVDLTECRFKTALMEGDMSKVKSILKVARLVSENIIDYIQKRGHPEVALLFMKDPETRFRLALEAGDLKVAVESATKINSPGIWESLADEAMLHGLFTVAEVALQRSGNKERLAFFYLISGQASKMNELDCDMSLSLQRAIWTNDRTTMGQLMKGSAPTLSAIALRPQGIDNKMIQDKEILGRVQDHCKKLGKPDAENNAKDDGSSEDWPILFVSRPTFELPSKDDEDDEIGAGWDDDDLMIDDDDNFPEEKPKKKKANDDDADDAWGLDDIGDIDAELAEAGTSGLYIAPQPGTPTNKEWIEGSHVPGEIAAAGYFGQALDELRTQIALINPEPLKKSFIAAYISAHASIPTFGSTPPLIAPVGFQFADRKSVPIQPSYLVMIHQKIANGQNEFTKANFAAAQQDFLSALQLAPLVVCNTNEELKEIQGYIETCRQYLTSIILEKMLASTSDKQRQLELAAYFTHCQLLKKHISLTLKKALTIAFREKNYQLVLEFGNRLSKIITLPEKIQKVMVLSQSNAQKQTAPKVNYDPRNPFEICCASLNPIYRGSQKVTCPFCLSCYTPSYSGTKCTVCQLCKVGAPDATGLVLLRSKNNDEY